MESSHRGALPTWRRPAEPNVAEPPPAPVAPHLEQETEEYELEDESEEDDDVLEEHSGVSSGRARSRPALVRAAPAAGLRFRRLSLLDSI